LAYSGFSKRYPIMDETSVDVLSIPAKEKVKT